jgi:hypothetical protein
MFKKGSMLLPVQEIETRSKILSLCRQGWKKPGFLKKKPAQWVFFVFFLVFCGFFGLLWVFGVFMGFLGVFCPDERVFKVFSV